MGAVDAAYEAILKEDRADDKDEDEKEREMERLKKSKFDVELYKPKATYDDLLDLVNDINKGDIDLDLRVSIFSCLNPKIGEM
jgi:hypothetical protein